MSGYTLQITTVTPSPMFLVNGRSFIMATDSLLKKTGAGSVHGVANESSITAEIQASDRNRLTALIESFTQTLARSGMILKVVLNDRVDRPLNTDQKDLAATFNAPPQKLTLRYLMSLPEGHFIMSNLRAPGGGSIYTELVASLASRADHWTKIRACGAAQRTCHVFPNESECRRWLKAWERNLPHPRK
jgi:hypothetical protein